MSRVIHFEIHATDPEALVELYTALLGWGFVRQQGLDYRLIETGPADQPGINGGPVHRPDAGPADTQAVNAFVCTVQVDSLDETLATNDRRGGLAALPKTPVPGVGWLAYVRGPDGNILGLLEPGPGAS